MKRREIYLGEIGMVDTTSFPDMEDDEDVRTATQHETLTFIEQMLEQLNAMAKKTDRLLLAYMIEMALVEAREALHSEARV